MPALARVDIKNLMYTRQVISGEVTPGGPMTNSRVPDTLGLMVREFSAGGVVLQRSPDGWQVAVIAPQKDSVAAVPVTSRTKKRQKVLLALPKGLVDPGEKPDQTAMREVREETGVSASLVTKLGDVKYVYVRSWGDKQRVFKIVSFYLLQYRSGSINELDPAMRIEVAEALWIPLEEAAARLTYKGEKEMIGRARKYLDEHPEL